MCEGIPAGQLAVKEDILPFCQQKQETVIREVATGRGIVCFLFCFVFWKEKKKGGGREVSDTTVPALPGLRPSTIQCRVSAMC